MNSVENKLAQHHPSAGLVHYTHLIYALHALAVLTGVFTASSITGRFLFGLPSIVAVILNYARRNEARGSWLETHFEWQIHTFWYALLWVCVTLLVSAPLVVIYIGVLLAIAGLSVVGLWVTYRVARGWLTLHAGQAMPWHEPTTAAKKAPCSCPTTSPRRCQPPRQRPRPTHPLTHPRPARRRARRILLSNAD